MITPNNTTKDLKFEEWSMHLMKQLTQLPKSLETPGLKGTPTHDSTFALHIALPTEITSQLGETSLVMGECAIENV